MTVWLPSKTFWIVLLRIFLFKFCHILSTVGFINEDNYCHSQRIGQLINPLTPVPPVTARAETHPQFPVLPLTAREKACEDNCLSYPPWRDFGPPIVLWLLRTNKPMRMDFLSIFLVDFRDPRKTVFCLEITHSKSAGNHGALWAKTTNFQSVVFIP